ncbi:MAG: Coq4 family protein [Cyanobacteria bacterium J06638_6]
MRIGDSSNPDLRWQAQVYERFAEILQAPYGDFQAIWNLANATNDAVGSKRTLDLLVSHPSARQAIQNRWRLGAIDLQQLHALPPETLGYSYADHLLCNGLTPIQRQATEDDYDYLTAHLTEVHDIWHVVINADTTMVGETKLQAFVAAQLRTSRFSFAMLAKNILKTAVEDLTLAEPLLDALAEGWSLGKQAHPFFGVQWQTLWQMPLLDLRRNLNVCLDRES